MGGTNVASATVTLTVTTNASQGYSLAAYDSGLPANTIPDVTPAPIRAWPPSRRRASG